jgi:hypothetical protein
MESTRPALCIPAPRLPIHSEVSWFISAATQGRGPLREQDLLQLRVMGEKWGRGIEEMGQKTGSRCPDNDEDDGFSCFISVPSGKYRTAVLLKLGHDHFLAHPSHFITSYPPPCSMAYTLNRRCTHPGWWGRRDC